MPIGSPQQVVPAGYCDVNHRLQRAGAVRPYTFGFGLNITGVSALDLQAVAAHCEQSLVDEIMPMIADSYVYVATEVRGSPADGGLVVVEEGSTIGGAAADPVACNTAVLVEKRSAYAGRQNQGRMFIPALISEANTGDGGGIETGARAALQTQCDEWFDQITGIGAIDDVVIFHSDYIRNPAVDKDDVNNVAYRIANPNANTPTVVTAFTVDPIVATQRRRMR